jgi:hypothetical protein
MCSMLAPMMRVMMSRSVMSSHHYRDGDKLLYDSPPHPADDYTNYDDDDFINSDDEDDGWSDLSHSKLSQEVS